MSLVDQMYFQNQHWTKKYIVPSFRRELFNSFLSSLDSKTISSVIGPRRVGKTTLIKQTINFLIGERNVEPSNILFFSLDLYKMDLLSIINSYKDEMQPKESDQLYFFFDEIQYLDEWASHVKLLFDNLENVKICITGSSSSDLFRGRESLAGRETELLLNPLSFDEYLHLVNKKTHSKKITWDLYLHYMEHQLPELMDTKISEREYIGQLVDKIINYDFTRLHNIKDTRPIDSIFRLICKSPGDVIVMTDLARDLNLDWRTVQNYLSILEKGLLIRKVYNYSKNVRKSEKGHVKYYPYYSTLHWYAFPYRIEFGKKAETEVAFQLNAGNYYNRKGKEIDFIIGQDLDIGVEVKMRSNISYKHVKNLVNNEITNQNYLVCKYDSKLDLGEDSDVIVVPLHDINSIGTNY